MSGFEKAGKQNDYFATKIESSWAELRPSFKNFIKIHPAAKIKNDEKRLKSMRAQLFAKESGNSSNALEMGETAEYCLMEILHNQGCFDESVTVSPSSEYDDYFSQVDLVLNICLDPEDENVKFLHLGIDVTSTTSVDVMEKKEEKLDELFRQGNLAKLEYFINDQEEDNLSSAVFMPRIILSLLPAEVSQLRNLLNKGKKITVEEKKLLEKYKAQIVTSIISQLDKCVETIKGFSDLPNQVLAKKRKNVLEKYQEVKNSLIKKKSE